MARASRSKVAETGRPSLLEWVAAAIGAAIVCLMFAVLGQQAATSGNDELPALHIEAGPLATGDGYHVMEIRVTNRSARTAAEVSVVGELSINGEVVETSSATLAYVPGNAARDAGLLFTRDPRRHSVRVRVTGFEYP